ERAGVVIEEDAVKALVDDLCQVRVQGPDGTFQTKEGPFVEPVQLQVVCERLWGQERRDPTRVTKEELVRVASGKGGGVDGALAAYYADRVKWAAEKGGVPERAVRDWFDKRLIASQRVRLSV